jgi:hypothetical protein
VTTITHFAAPQFQLRSSYSTLRALTVIVVCAAIVGGFLFQVLSGPTPEQLRAAAESASILLGA